MLCKILLITAIILVLLVLLMACHTKASHCWLDNNPEKKARWITKKIAGELDLTEAQKDTLNRIKDELLAKILVYRNNKEAENIYQQVLTIIKRDTLDRKLLWQLSEEKMQHIDEIRALMIDKLAEFHAMLTPAQKEKLARKLDRLYPTCHRWQ